MAIASVLIDPAAENNASTADSKAVDALAAASTADSKAVAAELVASSADSIADAAILDASTADSKAVVADDAASTADSKAVVAGATADGASTAVGSAIGSEPGVGDYKVTDVKRDTNGSIVFEYDDSQIT